MRTSFDRSIRKITDEIVTMKFSGSLNIYYLCDSGVCLVLAGNYHNQLLIELNMEITLIKQILDQFIKPFAV